MYGMLKGLASFVQLEDIRVDTNTFRLHYKATVLFFITGSLLVTSGQYLGDPIDCIVDGVPGGLMDTYCWIHSTFSIPSRWNAPIPSLGAGKSGEVPHPGIAPLAEVQEGEEVKYHKYYQWVAFVLFLQAAFFYLPKYLWDTAEGGKIKMLVGDLQNPMLTAEGRKPQIQKVVDYLMLQRGNHGAYALKFFGVEVLAFINCIVQIFFTDFFLGYEFTTFGTDVLNYVGEEGEDRPDPFKHVFPKVTKCTFHKYGPSGTVEKKDGLCVLALNIINEKIYIFLWFWMVFLAVVTGLVLIYRFSVILGSQIRTAIIARKGTKKTKRSDVDAILEPESLGFFAKLGDWVVLYLLVRNLNNIVVHDLINQLHKEEQGKNSNTETLKLKPESSAV